MTERNKFQEKLKKLQHEQDLNEDDMCAAKTGIKELETELYSNKKFNRISTSY